MVNGTIGSNEFMHTCQVRIAKANSDDVLIHRLVKDKKNPPILTTIPPLHGRIQGQKCVNLLCTLNLNYVLVFMIYTHDLLTNIIDTLEYFGMLKVGKIMYAYERFRILENSVCI